MSDTHEPPHPDGPADEPAPPPPPFSESPPPPPPSSTPPPPPADGGYGAPPPAEGGGYGAPPPENPYVGQPPEAPYSPTDAISYGWKKFAAAPATLLLPMLVAWVGVVVVAVVIELLLVNTVLGTHSCTQTIFGQSVDTQCGPGTFVRLLFTSLGYAITFMVLQILTAGIWRGALRITDGHDFSVGELFQGFDKAQVVIAAVLMAVGTFIGLVLCIIPGIIFAFLTMFTIPFVVDRQMQAVDAIKASIQLVRDNVSNTLLYFLLAYVVTFIGACLCGVGLLVAYPVVLVGYAYTFRRLQHQPVSPVA